MNNSWLINFSDIDNFKPRMYMLPFAGGNASMYADWADDIPDVSIVGIQYPGRGARYMEPCISDASIMASKIAQLIEYQEDQHFFIFGYSMGAALAFETLAKLKHKTQAKCLGLFVAARGAPDQISQRKPIHALDDISFIENLRDIADIPEEVIGDGELMDLLMPMLRSDFKLAESYQRIQKLVLPINITALFGEKDPYADRDASLGWSGYTSACFQYRSFSGGHFFINEHKNQLKFIVRENIRNQLSSATV